MTWRTDDPPQDGTEFLAAWRTAALGLWLIHPAIWNDDKQAFVESWHQDDEITPERWQHMPADPE